MTTSVKRAEIEEQELEPIKDTVSLAGGGNGFDYCHERSYSIVSSPNGGATQLLASDLAVTNTGAIIVSLSAVSDGNIGTHDAILKVRGPGSTFLDIPFTITITPCQIVEFTQVTPLLDHSYKIGDLASSWHYDQSFGVQSPLCGYTLEFEYSDNLNPDYTTIVTTALESTLTVWSLTRGHAEI